MAKIKIRYEKGGPSQLRALRAAMKEPIDPQESLAAVIAELNAFERQYGLTTIEFFARFKAGLMGDSRDFIKWAGLFEGYKHVGAKILPALEPEFSQALDEAVALLSEEISRIERRGKKRRQQKSKKS